MRESTDNAWGSMTLGVVAGLLWLSWQAIRLPVLAFLMILEPIVSTVLVARRCLAP